MWTNWTFVHKMFTNRTHWISVPIRQNQMCSVQCCPSYQKPWGPPMETRVPCPRNCFLSPKLVNKRSLNLMLPTVRLLNEHQNKTQTQTYPPRQTQSHHSSYLTQSNNCSWTSFQTIINSTSCRNFSTDSPHRAHPISETPDPAPPTQQPTQSTTTSQTTQSEPTQHPQNHNSST